METQLVKEAAQMAFVGGLGCEPIHHSDRGSQYASEQYASEGFRRLLEKAEILQSMSRRANCYDNALSESLKHGLPALIRVDNGSEFRSKVLDSGALWAKRIRTK